MRKVIVAAVMLLALAACGEAPSGEVRVSGSAGGVPVTTDLHKATGLPKGAVYSVARSADGWRVLYHRGAGSSAAIATRLCALEQRAPASVRTETVTASHQLPGVAKIIVRCA